MPQTTGNTGETYWDSAEHYISLLVGDSNWTLQERRMNLPILVGTRYVRPYLVVERNGSDQVRASLVADQKELYSHEGELEMAVRTVLEEHLRLVKKATITQPIQRLSGLLKQQE